MPNKQLPDIMRTLLLPSLRGLAKPIPDPLTLVQIALAQVAKLLASVIAFWVFLVCLAIILGGCNSLRHLPTSVQDIGPVYKPSNIYLRAATIPGEIRRVAILPVTTTTENTFLQSGAEALEATVLAELIKTKRFEVIPVTREHLMEWSGRIGWRVDERLPQDIFKKIRQATGCDAVLFVQLTRYHPYQPLAIGWKLSLIQTASRSILYTSDAATAVSGSEPLAQIQSQIFWSADEILDAGDPTIARASRAYYADHLSNEAPAADVSTMASSPARFGQYSLFTLLATLPERAQTQN